MKKILIINASPRKERSHSRKLTRLFVENWSQLYPDDIFIHREVGLVPPPPIDERWIAAAFAKADDRTATDCQALGLSDLLVNELKEADIYVIGSPMYNWSIPSGLKAYIDQVMRINETWKFESGMPDGNYVGLLNNKKLYILSSRGDSGYNEGEKNAHMNFQTSYLKFIFNTMGVHDIDVISLDNEEYGGERFAKSQRDIHRIIKDIK
ncbi:MAG TPA: NAD(P)H-dependent oxidoreductase [Pseudosphingobacterium sp.]|nr:NAD(P)H-dependent oxidoreductase [Pseudosphingobacterium sp.]